MKVERLSTPVPCRSMASLILSTQTDPYLAAFPAPSHPTHRLCYPVLPPHTRRNKVHCRSSLLPQLQPPHSHPHNTRGHAPSALPFSCSLPPPHTHTPQPHLQVPATLTPRITAAAAPTPCRTARASCSWRPPIPPPVPDSPGHPRDDHCHACCWPWLCPDRHQRPQGNRAED